MMQLPRLQDVERLSPRVIRILGDNPGKFTLQGTNTYLLGTGPARLLIDTAQGFPAWRTRLAALLRAERCTVSHALLTHWHIDHVAGVPDLRALCPAVKVCKHYPRSGGLRNGDGEGAEMQEEEQGDARDGDVERETYANISDGEVFAVQGARLRAVFCPGHTADHMAFLLLNDDNDDHDNTAKEEGSKEQKADVAALFTGDNVLGHGTALFESLPVYLASLTRMAGCVRSIGGGRGGDEATRSVNITGYPGHGDVLPDCHAKIQEYLQHRERREGEVLRALEVSNDQKEDEEEGKGRGKTAMEIVEVVYRDYSRELWEPARGGVIQILRKLQEEGKVEDCGGERWRLHESKPLEKPAL